MEREIPPYNEIRCGFSLPYCIRVPDGEYSYPFKDINVTLQLTRQNRASENEHLQVGMVEGENDVAVKDRFGRYDFTSVKIVLKKDRFAYCPSFDGEKIKVLVMQCLNRFIQFINRTHDIYWAIGLTADDVFCITLGCYLDGVNVPGLVFYAGTSNVNEILPWRMYLDRNRSNREEALSKLQSNYGLPLYVRLLVEGTRNATGGNPDIGVLLFDRSFELLFDTLVEFYMRNHRLYEKDWEKYIAGDLVGSGKGGRICKLRDYSRFLSLSGGEFSKGEDSYDFWWANCRQIRNDIAHGKLKEITCEAALEARKGVWKAFEFFGVFHLDDLFFPDEFFDQSKNMYASTRKI